MRAETAFPLKLAAAAARSGETVPNEDAARIATAIEDVFAAIIATTAPPKERTDDNPGHQARPRRRRADPSRNCAGSERRRDVASHDVTR
jgi:hypothetical protein